MKEHFLRAVENPELQRLIRWHARSALAKSGCSPDDVEDVEQELLLDSYRKYCQFFDPSRGSLFQFLKATFSQFQKRYVVKWHTAKRLGELQVTESYSEEIGAVTEDHDWDILQERINQKLDPDCVVVYSLMRLGWSQREIAEKLGKSRNTISHIVKGIIKPIIEEELCVT